MPHRSRSGRSRAPFSASCQVDLAAPKNVAVITAVLLTLAVGLTLLVRGLV